METMNTLPTVPVLPIGNGNNDLISAIMSLKNGDKDNNFTDNPFIWLIFLALLGNGSFGFGNNNNANNTNADIQRLEGLINNNQNNNIALSAIQGNHEAINQLANTFNCSVGNITNAIDNVRNAMSSCCCDIKTLIQSTSYETQIRDLQNTTTITNNLCNISNAINQGFATIGYNQATQTATIVENANANTQRIVDTLNAHWTAELNEKLQDARLKLSQSEQTQAIITALKPTTTTGA